MAHAHAERRSSLRPGQAVALAAALIALVLFFALEGVARDVVLTVKVHPAGAMVRLLEPALLQGTAERTASTGILKFDGLPRGAEARVVVRAKGYKDGLGRAQLPEEGGGAEIVVHLERQSGQLEITTDPADAVVFLDHRALGNAPQLVSNVAPGEHTVGARKPGFGPVSQVVVVDADASAKVHLVLQAIEGEDVAAAEPLAVPEEKPPPRGYGRLLLKSTHPSTFFVDDQIVGVSLELRRNVLAGPHLVGCRSERGQDNRRVEVVEGETLVVSFEFNWDPVEKAKKATDPSEPVYWVVNGGSARNGGRYGDAVDMFKKALELDPKYYPAHRQLGYTLPPLKRWDEAVEHMESYLELNPHAPDKEFAEEMIGIFQQYADAQAKGEPEPKLRWEDVGFREE